MRVKNKPLFLILYFASFVLGLTAPLIGLSVAEFAARAAIPLEQAGVFTSAHSLGAAIGTILIGYMLDKRYPRFFLFLSSGAIAVSLILLHSLSIGWAIILAFGVFGFGFGGLLIQFNVLNARIAEAGKVSASLNLLNLYFGIGLIVSPNLAPYAPYLLVGVLALMVTLSFISFPLIYVEKEKSTENNAAFQLAVLILFAMIFFLQLGSEVGVRAWLPTQAALSNDANVVTWAASLFGFGILLGRGAVASFGQRLSAKQTLILSTVIMILGFGLFVALPSLSWAILLAALLVGLAYAPLFPTLLAVIEAYSPAAFGRLSGICIFVGNMGAIAIPWLQGIVGGGQNGGMQLSLGIACLLFALMWLLPKGNAHDSLSA